MAATQLIPTHLRHDLQSTLSRLRMARLVDPKHHIVPGQPHAGCDICTATMRIDWLLEQVSVVLRTAEQERLR